MRIGSTLAAAIWLAVGLPVRSQSLSFTTLAGNAGYGSVDGAASRARFDFPEGVAADGEGNIYVADTENSTIRGIDSAGMVTTLAGSAGIAGSADGSGSGALFSHPQGIAVDTAGTLYVADTANSTIRRISATGVVSTIAGSPGVRGSADGSDSSARFNLPAGIAVDGVGVLYIADTYNNTIRMVAPAGTNWVVTTVAGATNASGFQDGTNGNARFYQPWGLAVDTEGSLYVADTGNGALRKITVMGTNWVTSTVGSFGFPGGVTIDRSNNLYVADSANNVIRKISGSKTNWTATVLAGSAGIAGNVDGPQGNNPALFNYPRGISWGSTGLLYVADSLNNTIRKVTSTGGVTTLAGEAGGPGSADGQGVQASFNAPLGLAVDGGTNIYVADSGNHTIRRVSPEGVVTTLAGWAAGPAGSSDGVGTNAAFDMPAAVAVDGLTNLYVADFFNNEIRKVTWVGTNWLVSTVAGRAGDLYFGTITNVVTNALASVTNVVNISFYPSSTYVNYSGAITNIIGVITNLAPYSTNESVVTNSSDQTITNVSVSSNLGGVVTNLAIGATNIYFIVTNAPLVGTNIAKSGLTKWTNVVFLATNTFTLSVAPPLLDGTGTNALFYHPSGIAVDQYGDLYVADGGTNGVRVITAGGVVTTLPGSAGAYTVSASQFGTNQLVYESSAVAVDGSGTVYVADAGNNTIRMIARDGSVTTIAGSAGLYGVADGVGGTARFASPVALALDGQENLWIADALSHTIRKVSAVGAAWEVITVGGWAGAEGSADGLGSDARFNHPSGIAVDGSGNVYVADTDNNTIRLGQPGIVVAPPALGWSWTSGGLLLSWPASAAGYNLETTGSLAGPGNWTVVTNVGPAVGNEFSITNPATLGAGYYRLRKVGP